MTEPFTPRRVELVERIRRSHENLDRLCDGLSKEQMARPGPEGWSVKDHLAHLAAWEQGIAALLQSRPRHAAMGIDRALWETHDTDAINAVLHERDRDRTVAEVRSAVDAAGQDLVAALGRLDDGDLVKPYA
ncbi:MAG TPA: maleylpyruvate isomerase N-terminal domain-containing protein, partial [Dehalococcoidia bacterium]|nr:maleylpyruvate isomerase N-terminal domain-containing protein [Dehalococcoidia bacterium]